jgi:N-acetylneuraminic acid mutarotase
LEEFILKTNFDMTRKSYRILILFSVLLIIVSFLFLGWVYAIGFFPLKDKVHTDDFDSSLSVKLPHSVTEAGGVSMNGNFYLLGGLGPFAQTYSSFYCFYNESKRWKKLKDFPCPISHPGITAGNEKIYVAGGFDPLGIRLRGFMFANWKPRSSFMIYTPETDEWTVGKDLPLPHGAGGVCYYDSAVYYAGGIDQSKQICNTLFRYDLRTNQWDSLPPMPTPRDHLRMEAVSGILYAISGRKDDLRFNLTCVEAFDIRNNTWSKKTDIPVGRGGLGSVVYNDKIYTFGGENVWSCFDSFEEYNPLTDKWRILNKLPEPRHGICAGVIGDEIHTVSGGIKPRISISSVHRIIKIK